MESSDARPVMLVSVAGPRPIRQALVPPEPVTVGRRANNTVVLTESDKISRQHARFEYDAGSGGTGWFLADNHSTHGTKLNGVQLEKGKLYPVSNDDLVEISPWTFRIRDAAGRRGAERLHTLDENADPASVVSEITTTSGNENAQRQLDLLLKCAETFHGALTELALAEALAEAAIAGTGFTNAAVLRPLEADGTVEMICVRGVDLAGQASVSRTLLSRASGGTPVRLSRRRDNEDIAVSIVQMSIDEAICIPIMLGTVPAGYLYLDCRQKNAPAQAMAASSIDFALGLGRLAALSLAGLARTELERRIAGVETEMRAARRAQVAILPGAAGQHGTLTYKADNRPGRLVSGDFYDVIPLADGRLAVTLGDVAGKGMAAAVLMTLAQGFLHLGLTQHGDMGRAFGDLNTYIHKRYGAGVFLTLWGAIIDVKNGSMSYVDAGHGYAFLMPAQGGVISPLREGSGTPIGVDPDCAYVMASASLGAADRLLLVSDGLIEQPGAAREGAEREGEYGADRLMRLMSILRDDGDGITALFRDVARHAGTEQFADDTTALMIWAG